MINFEDAALKELAIHYVGSNLEEDELKIADRPLSLDDAIRDTLKKYFVRFFKDLPFYRLHHESDLWLNECYAYAGEIFANPESLYVNSIKLAKHLFSVSDHHNIRMGEFYTALFDHVYVGDQICQAIGLFKSENKDTYLKVYPEDKNYKIEKEQGQNINKLDKGCLIFNVESGEGYKVMVIDNTSRNNEAKYWLDKFFKIKPLEDHFYHTQQYLTLCRDFAMESFPDDPMAEKLSLANDSEKFFRESEKFDKAAFHEKVLQEPELIDAFEEYKTKYQNDRQVNIVDEFDIAPGAVKKLKRVFKSVIKLDKNFHIYVHGNREYIRKGFDEESGLNYYQVFFREES